MVGTLNELAEETFPTLTDFLNDVPELKAHQLSLTNWNGFFILFSVQISITLNFILNLIN